MLTKQQRNPYIWNDKIKIKKKNTDNVKFIAYEEFIYDYEEETKEKVKVKKIGTMDKKPRQKNIS